MVTVVNEDTGEVIREIPSRELLDLAAKLEEAIGLIFDKKV
jgi:flagellar protein FlaG